MSIKVLEHGPFGCILDRGVIESMEQIPEGYCVTHIQTDEGFTVYLDTMKRDFERKPAA